MKERIAQLCTLMLACTTRIRLYGEDHRLAARSFDTLFETVVGLLASHDRLRMTISGDELHCESVRLEANSGPIYGLVRRFSEKGVGLLELRKGLPREQLLEFCLQLAVPESKSIRSHSHLVVGSASIEIRTHDSETEALRVQTPVGSRNDEVTVEAQELLVAQRRIDHTYEVQTRDFTEIALSLMSRFAQEDNLFLNLAEIRDHNLFNYIHTCNVATLSIGFGLSLGLSPNQSFDLGVAALLHDIGKSFIPAGILDKAGTLTEEEWDCIRMHPVEGARFLAIQPDVKPISVVIAYEHHMHFDRRGGYPETTIGPSVPSQLVAIADSYDALFGKRSYHAEYDVVEALEIIQGDSGTVYNPDLVDHFTRFVNVSVEEVDWSEREKL